MDDICFCFSDYATYKEITLSTFFEPIRMDVVTKQLRDGCFYCDCFASLH